MEGPVKYSSCGSRGSSGCRSWDEIVDEALVGAPAGVDSGERQEEGVGAEEVVGLEEAESLANVLAGLGALDGGGEVGGDDKMAEMKEYAALVRDFFISLVLLYFYFSYILLLFMLIRPVESSSTSALDGKIGWKVDGKYFQYHFDVIYR
ncbi:hypothetical protein LINPERHAP1_LOCUS20234 [Linum perenne]